MLYKNETTEDKMVLINKADGTWITLKAGETKELPDDVGVKYGFIPVEVKSEESSIGEVKIETKKKRTKRKFI